MNKELILGFQEQITHDLRSLYAGFGYTQYKMSKFEEYDLYAKNKDFLISDQVITFMDIGGKLMALKPDVTLSIVKNTKDLPDTVQKLYYTENIYRVAKGSGSFREMMQVGLECIGEIDAYCLSEVLSLAIQSLGAVSEQYVLNISHLGLLTRILDVLGVSKTSRDDILKAIGEKNFHDLSRLCLDCGMTEKNASLLISIVKLTGAPGAVLEKLEELISVAQLQDEIQPLKTVFSLLPGNLLDSVRMDFSVVDDLHYYNGIVFKGFVSGVPSSVLSGGQYDKLMRKMNRKSNAVGFAVYMDALNLLDNAVKPYDVDVLISYGQCSNLSEVSDMAAKLRREGNSVMVQKGIPAGLRYGQLVEIV